jgi:hypothetical protein
MTVQVWPFALEFDYFCLFSWSDVSAHARMFIPDVSKSRTLASRIKTDFAPQPLALPVLSEVYVSWAMSVHAIIPTTSFMTIMTIHRSYLRMAGTDKRLPS